MKLYYALIFVLGQKATGPMGEFSLCRSMTMPLLL